MNVGCWKMRNVINSSVVNEHKNLPSLELEEQENFKTFSIKSFFLFLSLFAHFASGIHHELNIISCLWLYS